VSRRPETYKPLSLAQHFEAPEDFIGAFGWLCGYSADAGFLDDAIERFTRQTRAQRAYSGRIALALMLDPGNPPITIVDVPGMHHMPLSIPPVHRPFRLLHAKIALLGFRHAELDQWQLRLIVSTGNWTRQTLEDSLDLVWRIDIANEDIKVNDATVRQQCAEVKAAWGMLDWLQGYFDSRVLDATPESRSDTESCNKRREVCRWVKRVCRNAVNVAPRFFDNRRASLLDQLTGVINEGADPVCRNYIGMGSGFYEGSTGESEIPSVIKKIVQKLRDDNLLTKNPEVDVFVNPQSCQAVAPSQAAFKKQNWSIRPAGVPEYFGLNTNRSLHAKFIFSANYRDNSDFTNSSWLYLGSGNLTGPGFENKMSRHGGNLEAGVLLTPDALRWKAASGTKPADLITNRLPVQWEQDTTLLADLIAGGDDMVENEVRFLAAPVSWVYWSVENETRWLTVLDNASQPYELLDEEGQPCGRDGASNRFMWKSSRPRLVQVRWLESGAAHLSSVPVLDEFGRFAANALPSIDMVEAWSQLANFPMPPDDEDLPSDDGPAQGDIATKVQAPNTSVNAVYPVRRIMQLIENIADKQTEVSRTDWAAWCTRLEQCLVQTSASPELNIFRQLTINPLGPLRQPPFRPAYAEDASSDEGRRYEAVLRKIEMAWDVGSFTNFGELA
jgi:hypothetical protein